MISKNAPLYVHITYEEGMNPLAIAEKELESDVLPFILRRYLPNGEFEDWKLT